MIRDVRPVGECKKTRFIGPHVKGNPPMPTPHQMIGELATLGYRVLVVGPRKPVLEVMQQVLPHTEVEQKRTTNGTTKITTPNSGVLQVNSLRGARGYSADVLVTVGLTANQITDALPVLSATGGAHINL